MRTVWLATIAVCAAGCVEVGFSETDRFDPSLVGLIDVDVARGDLEIAGRQGEGVLVRRHWGRAGSESKADERARAARSEWSLEAGALVVRAPTPSGDAGVDVTVVGPVLTDLVATTGRGTIDVIDVEGVWNLEGDQIQTTALAGEGSIVTTGPSTLEIWPYLDGVVSIDVIGEATLVLPAFGPYDIIVAGDPNHEMLIQDLGFDVAEQGPGTFAAIREPGTVRIDVRVVGGPFALVESVR